MEVFHNFRENLKVLQKGEDLGRETSEYASEVSEDFNSVDGSCSETRSAVSILF